jgi:hypothetical protein
VPQFRQPHVLLTRFRRVCDEELPGLTDRLLAAGCVRLDHATWMPVPVPGPRRGDDLRMVTGRRPVVEAVVAAAAEEAPGVRVRRGVRVAGLVRGATAVRGVPHAAGVRTDTGAKLPADLVVDATGRRGESGAWLAGLGGRAPVVESARRSFAYYSRYFTGPAPPAVRGRPCASIGTFTLVTLHADNGAWSVTVLGLTDDVPLRAVRDPAVFTRVVAACPLQAHWLDGAPATGVLHSDGVRDCRRRFTVAGLPVVTGYVAIGDAWACTDRPLGRGLSLGLMHAQLLRHAARGGLDDPAGFARDWDARSDAAVAPYHRDQVVANRVRAAEMDALRTGRPRPARRGMLSRLAAAAAVDPDAYRGLVETAVCTALPQEVLDRPAVAAAVARRARTPPPVPGPDRAELLKLLG